VILAILSIVAGFAGVPAVLGGHNQIEEFIGGEENHFGPGAPEAAAAGVVEDVESEHAMELLLMGVSTAIALLGLALAYLFYVARPELPARVASRAESMYTILTHKYYLDELYDAVIVRPVVQGSREILWKVVDKIMIDGAVEGSGKFVQFSAAGLKRMQTGYVRTYAGWILFGGIITVAWFLR
jgi:NADH-quinone oxidoreductase subunit L